MFELERGDAYALEGRVIVYAENLKPQSDAELFRLAYSATSPIDIFLFDEEIMDPYNSKIKQAANSSPK